MTPKQRKFRADLIKIIHILKNDKAMDDEMYRAILSDRYNVNSSKDLSIDNLKDFALVLGYKGFETKEAKFNRLVDWHCATTTRNTSTKTQIATIIKLWQTNNRVRNKEIAALMLFCHRIIGYIPFSLGRLSKDEASKMINAIKNIK